MSKTCAFVILQHNPDNKYKGNHWVVMASPVGRLHHLAEAIQLADSGFEKRGTKADLKIAICPEHYLSKKHSVPLTETGTRVVDMFHEIGGVIPILQRLKQLSDSYPDWLIIPGTLTVLGLQPVKGKDVTTKTLVPNFSPTITSTVSKDAEATNKGLAKFQTAQVLKMQQAPEQEFRPCYNLSPVYFGGKIVLIRRKVYEAFDEGVSGDRVGEISGSTFFPMLPGQSILEIQGLRVGIEICAEHEHGFLAWQAKGALDLHIVISNEVYPFAEHCAIRSKGLFVHAGSTMTGTYHEGELPSSVKSESFEYHNMKRPGIYCFVEDVG